MNTTSVICCEESSCVMTNAPPIVFVVDDDISMRESLGALIQDEGWRVETFMSAEAFLNRPHEIVPHCLVLDISMPGLNGLELQKRLAVQQPEMPIIFMTGHGDISKSVQAMKAGAVEFLTKPFNDSALLSAVRDAIERSKVLVDRNAELQALKSRFARLTSREREVFALVAAGLLNKQVGNELGISVITVKAHRGCVMRKMKAESLPELVNMAARLRLPRLKNSNIPASK